MVDLQFLFAIKLSVANIEFKRKNMSNSCNGCTISKLEPMIPIDWKILLDERKSFANIKISQLLEQMEKSRWVLKNVLLSPSEYVTYKTLRYN